jgi:hypothetical protein
VNKPVTSDEFVAEMSHNPNPFEVPYVAMSTPDKPQTLDEFVAEMKKDIETFEANWRKQNKVEPGGWPLEMGGGDWYDQFVLFEATGDKS